jgi:glycosyltransferase involved in cell wall biosynthesis
MNSNYCCYFDHRYLARGLAMIRSLRKWHSSATVWVLCLSEECHRVLSELREPGVNLLRVADLELEYPALAEARTNRSLIEFYFTCTPSLVRYVLDKVAEGAVVTYVDGDLYFFSDPQPLFDELRGKSVSIIPHRFPRQLKHLEKYGLYNVGWMSFRNDASGQAVVRWWQDRCNEWCYDVLDGDRFADQKYLDRIATDFDGVVALTHRGANVAPWNLRSHKVSRAGVFILVDKVWPLIFFHFHGLRRIGRRIYIPSHFRYKAPFGWLIRTALYRPYIRHLEEINEELAGYLVVPKATLARYVSEKITLREWLLGWLKKRLVKDALSIAAGEFLVVRRAPKHPSDSTEGVPTALKFAAAGGASLRIIVVHNYYGSSAPSGENNAVDAEIAMLRRAGHSVYLYSRMSDEIRNYGWRGLVLGGLASAWNPFEILRFKGVLKRFKPDIIHVHNTFPLISPGILWAIRGPTATIFTLHNYRVFCASGMLLRDGSICTQCMDKASAWPGLKHGCYRNSRVSTLPLTLSISLHRAIGTWRNRVDAMIALTEFQRNRLVAAGMPADRMYLKTNLVKNLSNVVPWQRRGNVAVFVGRLSAEKGVDHLIRAWLDIGAAAPTLRIVGGGPLQTELQELVRSRGAANVEFLGVVPPEIAIREISLAKLLIVPSICLEGFPVVLQEAFASGTPSAVSDLGSLPTIVKEGGNGFVFKAGSAAAIVELIERVWGNDELLMHVSAQARASHDMDHTEEMNHRRLMGIYEAAVHFRQRRQTRSISPELSEAE